MSGMNTLGHHDMPAVEVRNVYFDGDLLFIELSDERHIGLPFKKITWLDWLAKTTPEQRAKWAIEPYGYAVGIYYFSPALSTVKSSIGIPLPSRRLFRAVAIRVENRSSCSNL